jgi:hypothetical protein
LHACLKVAPHLTPGALTDQNYHPRSNVYFAAADPEDADKFLRGCGLLAGVAMVALQCMVVVGVGAGTAWPACGSTDQCPQAGTYCTVGADDRCAYCGDFPPLPDQIDPATGGTLNDPQAPDFAGYNLTAVAELCTDPTMAPSRKGDRKGDFHTVSSLVSWCKFGNKALDVCFDFSELSRWHTIMPIIGETCVHPIDGTVDPLTNGSLMAANVAAMGIVDWAALLFATSIAALAVVGELKVRCVLCLSLFSLQKFRSLGLACFARLWSPEQAWWGDHQDIALCAIAIARAGDRLSRGSQLALTLLGGVRRWLFLPTLVSVVPFLVLIKGGDALSICFNTIAILFLTEVTC